MHRRKPNLFTEKWYGTVQILIHLHIILRPSNPLFSIKFEKIAKRVERAGIDVTRQNVQDLSHHEFPAHTIEICASILEDPDAYAKSLLDRPVANTAEGNVIHAAEEPMFEGFRQKEQEEAEKKAKKKRSQKKGKKDVGKKKLVKKPTKKATSPKSLIDERMDADGEEGTERKTTTKGNLVARMKTPAHLSMSSNRMNETLNPPEHEDNPPPEHEDYSKVGV